jgi:hypothetical protein
VHTDKDCSFTGKQQQQQQQQQQHVTIHKSVPASCHYFLAKNKNAAFAEY